MTLRIICIVIIHINTINSRGTLRKTSPYHDVAQQQPMTTQFVSTIASIDDNHLLSNIKQPQLEDDTTSNMIQAEDLLISRPLSVSSDHDNSDSSSDDSYDNKSANITINSYKYDIVLTNMTSYPILSYINQTSTYQQVFNPSWIPTSNDVKTPGLMVQVQNCSLEAGTCQYCNSTPGLAFTTCNPLTGKCDKLTATSQQIPYHLVHNHNHKIDKNYIQNPTIFYWNDLYYMYVTKLHNGLQLWSSSNPTESTANWTELSIIFGIGGHKTQISGPATLVPTDSRHYLFYGGESPDDGHIYITNSCDILRWNISTTPWLSPRKRGDYFDRDGVESGPPAIKMYDGNYLMLYNGYKIDNNYNKNVTTYIPHSDKRYSIGWLILDGNNVSNILQRSNKPIISPQYKYQKGDIPYTCTQYQSVYAKGIVRIEGTNESESFRVYFSAADTSVGTAVITITHSTSTSFENYLELAIIVSICCVVFVLMMVCVIWCKNQQSSELDLTTEPEFISIASQNRSSFTQSRTHRSSKRHQTTPNTQQYPTKHHHHHHHHTADVNTNHYYNPNHVHAHSINTHYDEEDDLNINTSLSTNSTSSTSTTSSTSSTSTTTTSSSTSTSANSSTATGSGSGSHTNTSTGGYCPDCHGKYHKYNDNNNETSQSETIRLSQISFRINETLEKDSPTSDGGNNFTMNPPFNQTKTNKNKFNFTNQTSLGESLL